MKSFFRNNNKFETKIFIKDGSYFFKILLWPVINKDIIWNDDLGNQLKMLWVIWQSWSGRIQGYYKLVCFAIWTGGYISTPRVFLLNIREPGLIGMR